MQCFFCVTCCLMCLVLVSRMEATAWRDCTVQEKSLVDSEFNLVIESAQATREV